MRLYTEATDVFRQVIFENAKNVPRRLKVMFFVTPPLLRRQECRSRRNEYELTGPKERHTTPGGVLARASRRAVVLLASGLTQTRYPSEEKAMRPFTTTGTVEISSPNDGNRRWPPFFFCPVLSREYRGHSVYARFESSSGTTCRIRNNAPIKAAQRRGTHSISWNFELLDGLFGT